MQKGAKKYFPALLFNFNWLSCFVLFLDFTEPSSLQPTPTTYLRTYVDLSCWRQFHFSIATREPVNGHKDCWKPETSLRLTNIHSFIVLMLFWACTAIHTYYFLTASFIKVSTLNYWDIYCLIHIFKPSSYLDNGKIYLADPCRLIGSLIFSFFLCNQHDFFSRETTDENATTKKDFSNSIWICHILVWKKSWSCCVLTSNPDTSFTLSNIKRIHWSWLINNSR